MYKHEVLVTRASLLTTDGEAAVAHDQPSNFTHAGSWARRARFTIAVHGVEGAPTAWSLKAKVRDVMMHAGDHWRYQERRWFALPDHDFDIADQSKSLAEPIIIVHDVENFGSDARLQLIPVFTGGANPGLRLTVTRELWG